MADLLAHQLEQEAVNEAFKALVSGLVAVLCDRASSEADLTEALKAFARGLGQVRAVRALALKVIDGTAPRNE